MASSALQSTQAGSSARALTVLSIDDTTVFQNIDLGGTTLRGAHFKNGSGASAAYVHLWNDAVPVLGTTAQHAQIPLATSQELTVFVVQGGAFSTGLSVAATSDRGTVASTNPASAVTCRLATLPG